MILTSLLFLFAVAQSALPCDPVGQPPLLEGCYRRCRWWGDPHYETFDGFNHDFQGKGIFQHVGPCDDDYTVVPFDISAELVPWSSTWTATSKCREIIITLYDSLGNVDATITLLSSTGPSQPDGTYYYNGGDSKYVVSGNTVSVFVDANQLLPDVVVQFPVSGGVYEALVDLDEGYKNYVCGLCGYFDDDPTNDLQDPDCENVVLEDKSPLEYTQEDWETLNKVGEATFNGELIDDVFRPNEPLIIDSDLANCLNNRVDDCKQQFQQVPNYDTCCPQARVDRFCDRVAMDCCTSDDPDNCFIINFAHVAEEICPCWHI